MDRAVSRIRAGHRFLCVNVAKNVMKNRAGTINKGFYICLRTKRSGVRIFYRTANGKTPKSLYLQALRGFFMSYNRDAEKD